MTERAAFPGVHDAPTVSYPASAPATRHHEAPRRFPLWDLSETEAPREAGATQSFDPPPSQEPTPLLAARGTADPTRPAIPQRVRPLRRAQRSEGDRARPLPDPPSSETTKTQLSLSLPRTHSCDPDLTEERPIWIPAQKTPGKAPTFPGVAIAAPEPGSSGEALPATQEMPIPSEASLRGPLHRLLLDWRRLSLTKRAAFFFACVLGIISFFPGPPQHRTTAVVHAVQGELPPAKTLRGTPRTSPNASAPTATPKSYERSNHRPKNVLQGLVPSEREAVNALIAGDLPRAARLYAALASAQPRNDAFKAAAKILKRQAEKQAARGAIVSN